MRKKIFIFLMGVCLVPILTGSFVFAQDKPPEIIKDVGGITKVLENIRNVLYGIATFIVVIMIIWAGILYMTAAGDPEKISKAKKALIGAIIGGGIAVIATGVIALMTNLMGG